MDFINLSLQLVYSGDNLITYFCRGKRTRNSQSLVAVTAGLKSDDDDDDEEEGLCDGEDDLPSWQLFNTVKNCTNSQGISFFYCFC